MALLACKRGGQYVHRVLSDVYSTCVPRYAYACGLGTVDKLSTKHGISTQ